MCMVCCLHVCLYPWCPWRSEKRIRCPKTGVTDGCETPCWCQESNLDSLEEQPQYFSPPSLQPLQILFLKQSHWIWTSPVSWPASLRHPASLAFPLLGLLLPSQAFCVVAGGPNPGPYACTASSLQTEPSLQSHQQHFQLKHSPLQEDVHLASREWTWPLFHGPWEIIQAKF